MSGVERATRAPRDFGDRRNHGVAASRLPATLSTSTRFAETVTGSGERVLCRLTVGALARADQIRAAGRTPRPTAWEGNYRGERTADNPRGLPEIVVTAVR
jgi:hypothetical protein